MVNDTHKATWSFHFRNSIRLLNCQLIKNNYVGNRQCALSVRSLQESENLLLAVEMKHALSVGVSVDFPRGIWCLSRITVSHTETSMVIFKPFFFLSLYLYLPSSRLILFCSSDCLIIDSSRVWPFPSFALLALSRASTCSSYLTEKQNCNGWNKQSLASNWNELTLICILILEFVTQIKFISVRLKPFMPPLHINRKIKIKEENVKQFFHVFM